MTTSTQAAVTTQVYRVYIKATPEAIWTAITKPEWTKQYGYGGEATYDLRLEPIHVVDGPGASHIRFRVVR